MEKTTATPSQGPQPLQVFQQLLAAGAPDGLDLDRLLADLDSGRRLEHAWLFMKQARLDPALWGGVQARLKVAVDQARNRRMSQWQTDPNRRTVRLTFEVLPPACIHPPAALPGALARALLEAGLPVAMGLEKSPRPVVHLGHPLPALVAGHGEWADAVLLGDPGLPLAELPALINAHAPQGLRILQCLQVPNYASPVADLCRAAHWRWRCPAGTQAAARLGMEAFIGAERFEIERTGKTAGQKGAKRVDIRPLLDDCRWADADLLFRTRILPGEAANPRKLLAAILGLEPAAIQDLARLRLELAEDPRLLQADKFEPKLHNMFEDAVLLHSGSNIRIVEDDDDDPVRLG